MQSSKGFTLVEMMIVVAIIGILAAIAWPSYRDSVMRSNRAEAKTELMDLAQRLQKCYTTYGRYDDPPGDDICAVSADLNDGGYVTRGKQFYRVNIAAAPDGNLQNSFVLTATAIKAPQTQDLRGGCNVLTLANIGTKGPVDCW